MTYEIKSGVPMPKAMCGTGRLPVYPFMEMDVGQHFEADIQDRNRIASACSTHSKRHSGMKFSIRKIDDNTIGCWRIA